MWLFIKGAKAHRGRGFASNLLNRSLKRTAKESLRHKAMPCWKAMTQIAQICKIVSSSVFLYHSGGLGKS